MKYDFRPGSARHLAGESSSDGDKEEWAGQEEEEADWGRQTGGGQGEGRGGTCLEKR